MPEHIRMMYRSFELDMEQTETAVEMILNDVMQPRFKKFRKSFSNKAFRALGYGGYGSVSGPDSTVYKEIEKTIDALAEGKVPPMYAYSHLLALKKVEKKEEAAETAAENAKEKPVDGATGNPAETPAN
jgi:hypothetical protein